MKKNITRQESIGEIYEGEYGYAAAYNCMHADLKGRVALVTGGTGMIGGATATLLARSGANVVVWGRNAEAGAEKERELRALGGDSRFDRVDLTDKAATDAAVRRILDRYGRIDILFANAGANFTNRQPIDKYDIDLFDRNIDVNLYYGTVNLCQQVLPAMMRQHRGSIIFTSSVCGYSGLRKQSGFVASKFAVSQLGRSMAMEYGKYNIRVNVLCPGSLPQPKDHLNVLWDSVDFDDYDGNFERPQSMVFDIAARRPAYPTDMAGLVLYLASDDACYTTGQVIMVDGGWTCGLSGEY